TSIENYIFEIFENEIRVTDYNRKLRIITGNFGHVNAAFGFGDEVTFISGRDLTTYKYTGTEIFDELIQKDFVFVNVFKKIDTAMVYDEYIWFTSNSFFVRAPINGGNASPPQLMQNFLFKCDDNQYLPMKKVWNVSNFEQFKQFNHRRLPEIDYNNPLKSVTKS
ncbi:MAG: hypothetical protein O7C56_09105, partial [Rickettsia endosymbiont of Ixodes persulcatus]|nr:hypothetical protein [Rickettsia endosymbiont of Ixodes persulcatus]